MTRPTHVVGIGGSAGALPAFKALLEALPPDTGMAFVFILHLLPTANSQLAQILARRTTMPVRIAADGRALEADHVYVIAPNADLYIENACFRVVSPRTGRNKQIDGFFISLARDMGPRAIGVLMSGYDSDGSEGCAQIRRAGGVTFAQDGSAEIGEMPRRAQAAGHIDAVHAPDRIGAELARIAGAQ